jgi:hypothetical protein
VTAPSQIMVDDPRLMGRAVKRIVYDDRGEGA